MTTFAAGIPGDDSPSDRAAAEDPAGTRKKSATTTRRNREHSPEDSGPSCGADGLGLESDACPPAADQSCLRS
ncbi:MULTISPECIES: hypothetical protein [unclassified Rhodococcus (in: high G+C Gram-positive bacteria)]|uniref:hypothetical protein n=1 Tax=unclassified Rhodococcus (in: high G+C Gram-positive bacteria) TaxID=192944 RepID=UPI0012E3AFCD|nr:MULTISPECIES: hypothetical protein [unclassified Rhodococcus (in: high G+C Gram-positive bacteria)]